MQRIPHMNQIVVIHGPRGASGQPPLVPPSSHSLGFAPAIICFIKCLKSISTQLPTLEKLTWCSTPERQRHSTVPSVSWEYRSGLAVHSLKNERIGEAKHRKTRRKHGKYALWTHNTTTLENFCQFLVSNPQILNVIKRSIFLRYNLRSLKGLNDPWWFRRINCSKLCYAGFSCWSRLQACKFSRSAPKKASKRWSSKAELQIWLTKSVRQEPVSSKHSYFATCLLFNKKYWAAIFSYKLVKGTTECEWKIFVNPEISFPQSAWWLLQPKPAINTNTLD